MATRLRQLCDRLEDTQFPNDVTQTELLLVEHDEARRDLKRDLETVIDHGEQLLVCFKQHHHDNVDVVVATQLLPASRATQVMAVERSFESLYAVVKNISVYSRIFCFCGASFPYFNGTGSVSLYVCLFVCLFACTFPFSGPEVLLDLRRSETRG